MAVPADYKMEMKESEKINKYLDLARELRKLWNVRVTLIPLVICVFGTVPKILKRELDRRTNRDNY